MNVMALMTYCFDGYNFSTLLTLMTLIKDTVVRALMAEMAIMAQMAILVIMAVLP